MFHIRKLVSITSLAPTERSPSELIEQLRNIKTVPVHIVANPMWKYECARRCGAVFRLPAAPAFNAVQSADVSMSFDDAKVYNATLDQFLEGKGPAWDQLLFSPEKYTNMYNLSTALVKTASLNAERSDASASNVSASNASALNVPHSNARSVKGIIKEQQMPHNPRASLLDAFQTQFMDMTCFVMNQVAEKSSHSLIHRTPCTQKMELVKNDLRQPKPLVILEDMLALHVSEHCQLKTDEMCQLCDGDLCYHAGDDGDHRDRRNSNNFDDEFVSGIRLGDPNHSDNHTALDNLFSLFEPIHHLTDSDVAASFLTRQQIGVASKRLIKALQELFLATVYARTGKNLKLDEHHKKALLQLGRMEQWQQLQNYEKRTVWRGLLHCFGVDTLHTKLDMKSLKEGYIAKPVYAFFEAFDKDFPTLKAEIPERKRSHSSSPRRQRLVSPPPPQPPMSPLRRGSGSGSNASGSGSGSGSHASGSGSGSGSGSHASGSGSGSGSGSNASGSNASGSGSGSGSNASDSNVAAPHPPPVNSPQSPVLVSNASNASASGSGSSVALSASNALGSNQSLAIEIDDDETISDGKDGEDVKTEYFSDCIYPGSPSSHKCHKDCPDRVPRLQLDESDEKPVMPLKTGGGGGGNGGNGKGDGAGAN